MSKIIFLDADGVMVKLRQRFSSDRLHEEYNIPLEDILPLYKNEYQECILGHMDFKEALIPYMKSWNWQRSVEELLEYLWKEEKHPNQEVVSLVDEMRSKGHKFFLATDQEKYKADYLMNTMGLKEHLDGAFFSCNVGISKSKKEYWDKVLKELGVTDPADIYFLDDEEENIIAARSAGVQATLYKSIDDLKTLNNL